MTALVVEPSVWQVAEQTGWLVLKAQRQLEALDEGVWMKVDALDLELAAEAGLTGPVREHVVSPLVPADCLPHPCPYTGHEQHPRMCEQYTEPLPGLPGCGGSGTVAEPFHLGTEQVSTNYVAAHWSPWTVSSNPKWNYKVDVKFRQALLATAVITSPALPVVDTDSIDGGVLDDVAEWVWLRGGRPRLRRRIEDRYPSTPFPQLAGVVSPGDVVVRVELTPLEEPITHYMGNCTGRGSDGPDWTPLDLPLGVFTKEEQ